ncbi:MAG TPA: TetR/AcrR family transcriptional regulator, partial [Solirubrobacteraceae bacterium]|nr:TetR/AcrR family transcriptional regulator [Solirubrobacteraceae bacterium]
MYQHGEGRSGAGSIAPLYQRLPRGPHHLPPKEVARHQRLRMHGAMVEAVAASGYADTSVKQVIGLAGVSRRAFYEQFANKEECFLATFDLIAARGAKRVNSAYRSSPGDLEQRLRAAFGELTDGIESDAKGARLAIVEAQTAGVLGLAHLRRAAATFERMLCSSFAHAPDAQPLPIPVVRGIVGGVHEAISVRLREERAHEIPAIGKEMLSWTLLFQTPDLGRLSEQLLARARASSATWARARLAPDPDGHDPDAGPALGMSPPPSARAGSSTNGHGHGAPPTELLGELRERLLLSVLRLAAIEDFDEMSAPQIAERAGVPIEVFFEFFESKEECFLAAFDELSDELLRIAADPDLVSGDWPHAVRRVVRELMGMLAARPLYAQTIACVAPGAGAQAIARDFELAENIATLLTEGAPRRARNHLATEGVAGAIWHTIRCQVVSGQIHLLPALADYL